MKVPVLRHRNRETPIRIRTEANTSDAPRVAAAIESLRRFCEPGTKAKHQVTAMVANGQIGREDFDHQAAVFSALLDGKPAPSASITASAGSNHRSLSRLLRETRECVPSAATPPVAAAPAPVMASAPQPEPVPQLVAVESHESFMAREFPDTAAGLGLSRAQPVDVPARTRPDKAPVHASGPESPADAERRVAQLAYRPPTDAEARSESMLAGVRAMTDEELVAASSRALSEAERQAVSVEAAHRSWMAERFPKAAKAAGYTPRPFDITGRRPVEGRYFSS